MANEKIEAGYLYLETKRGMKKIVTFTLLSLLIMTPILMVVETLKAVILGGNIWQTMPTKGGVVVVAFCYIFAAVLAVFVGMFVNATSNVTIKKLLTVALSFLTLFYLLNKLAKNVLVFGNILSEIVFIPSVFALIITSYMFLKSKRTTINL